MSMASKRSILSYKSRSPRMASATKNLRDDSFSAALSAREELALWVQGGMLPWPSSSDSSSRSPCACVCASTAASHRILFHRPRPGPRTDRPRPEPLCLALHGDSAAHSTSSARGGEAAARAVLPFVCALLISFGQSGASDEPPAEPYEEGRTKRTGVLPPAHCEGPVPSGLLLATFSVPGERYASISFRRLTMYSLLLEGFIPKKRIQECNALSSNVSGRNCKSGAASAVLLLPTTAST